MQTYQVTFPAGVPFEVIAQALKYVGGEIVERAAVAPVRKPAASRKTAAAVEYRDLPVYKDGEVIREIDGVTVAKLIAKMEGDRKRRASFVSRRFDDYAKLIPRKPEEIRVQEYMGRFCSALHHVPAQYTNGVTA